jgi:hypothetical protein
LNYQTQWMDRDQIVETSYKAALELNQIKLKHGLISSQDFQGMKRRVEQSLRASEAIDRLVENSQGSFDQSVGEAFALKAIRLDVFRPEYPTVCEKKELKWPARIFSFNLPHYLLKLYSLVFIIPNFIRNLLMGISGKR